MTTSPANPSDISVERGGDGVGAVGRDPVVDDLEPGGVELLDERPPAGVVAGAVDDAVADGQHLGAQRCRSRGRR